MNRRLFTLGTLALALVACDSKSSAKKDKKDKDDDEDDDDGSSKKKKSKDKDGDKSSGVDRSATKAFGGDEAGAVALVKALNDGKTDGVALTKALRPDSADFKAIFVADAASKAETAYKKLWDAPDFGAIKGKPEQTEALVDKATTDDVIAWNANANNILPGGYEEVKTKFNKGLPLYRFKFVKPGEKLGMAYDGLIYVNGHWVFVPKPWKYLGG
jgi:hypothetical protein